MLIRWISTSISRGDTCYVTLTVTGRYGLTLINVDSLQNKIHVRMYWRCWGAHPSCRSISHYPAIRRIHPAHVLPAEGDNICVSDVTLSSPDRGYILCTSWGGKCPPHPNLLRHHLRLRPHRYLHPPARLLKAAEGRGVPEIQNTFCINSLFILYSLGGSPLLLRWEGEGCPASI